MTDEARAGEPRPSTEAGRSFRLEWIVEGRWTRDPDWLTQRILAIEREAAAAPALDVERLAEAYDNVMMRRGRAGGVPTHIFGETAAEYARLSESALEDMEVSEEKDHGGH